MGHTATVGHDQTEYVVGPDSDLPPLDGTPVSAAVGVLGWHHLDPILLAALALQAPLLLVGDHGTAKTFLVEQLAEAIKAEFRHYNAALLNYDDLVGIPLPDEAGGLRFVGTPGAIWGAEFAFFDEVNRCRPDLQNKMFPIVHERRVAGVALPSLRHRWAAMNPPNTDDEVTGYLGTELLDTALADRFWFVVRVPGWSDLSRPERLALSTGAATPTDRAGAEMIPSLVAEIERRLPVAESTHSPYIGRYVVTLVELLRQAEIPLSPRRARLLVRSIIAVHTAAAVAGHVLTLRDAAELTLLNGLPQWAEPTLPSSAQVVAAHVQSWTVTGNEHDPAMRAILEEGDTVSRVRLGLDLGVDEPTLARLVTGALASQPTDANRIALAVVFARALTDHALTPAAWSPIAEFAGRVLRPTSHTTHVAPGPRLEAWRSASAWLARQCDADHPTAVLEGALVNACGPELLVGIYVPYFIATFRRTCEQFGVTG
ncbi:MAG: MoxR family ATPase [Acidimicrobiales bacterium]